MDFFKELLKLYEKTPKAAMFNLVNVNSPYGNYMDRCKNCYLLSNAFDNEDCFYCRWNFPSSYPQGDSVSLWDRL